MEIQITFSTIIGVLMVVIVTIAAVAILGSLTKVSIGECMPAEYTAARGFGGSNCGTDSLGRQLSCQYVIFGGRFRLSDTCIDPSKNLCCPIFSDRDQVQYAATTDKRGVDCGKDSMNNQLRCDANDRCIDNENNICSPQTIRIIEGKCCRIVQV